MNRIAYIFGNTLSSETQMVMLRLRNYYLPTYWVLPLILSCWVSEVCRCIGRKICGRWGYRRCNCLKWIVKIDFKLKFFGWKCGFQYGIWWFWVARNRFLEGIFKTGSGTETRNRFLKRGANHYSILRFSIVS